MIELTGLRALYQSMRQQSIDRYRFTYQRHPVIFDIFFFIDEDPFELLFGARGYNFSLEYSVHRGFLVDPTIKDKDRYRELCQILQLRFDPDNPFSPKAFLEGFNRYIPTAANPSEAARPEDIAKYRRDVEEADRIYFWRWHNNPPGSHVTEDNLNKTRMLLGFSAYEICKRKNISTQWTDVRKDAAKNFALPE